MNLRRALGAFALALLLATGLAACGDDGGDEADETTTTTEAEEETTTTTEADEFDPDAGGGDDEEEEGPDEGEENTEEQDDFADDVTEQVTSEISVPTGTPYSGYTLQFNDDRSVEASLPDEWETLGVPEDGSIFPDLTGAPRLLGASDIAAYSGSWAESGAEVRLVATDQTDTQLVAEAVAGAYGSQCDVQPTEELELEDDYYFGHVVVGLDCAETETDYVTIAADRDGTGGLVLVNIQIANTADLGALEEILATFAITTPG
jgi:hypothetical protein